MQTPLQITFRHMGPSPALEERIRARVAELEQFFARIVSCHVTVECRHQRQHQGKLFDIGIALTLPGCELVVNRDTGLNHAHEDAYVAVRDAFDAVRRQLEDYARRGRGAEQLHGTP